MLTVRTEEIKLSDGRKLIVSEADWDMADLAREMEQENLKTPSGDPLMAIMDAIFPSLYAYTKGKKVPDKQEALGLALTRSADFDLWFSAVRRLNPSKFRGNGRDHDKDEKRVVQFRDGSKITVINSDNHPSMVFKAQEIRSLALQQKSDNIRKFTFQTTFYPAMAACSTGDVPSLAEVMHWPETELAKWYEACSMENPTLFPSAVREAEVAAEQTNKKKSTKRKRSRSSRG